MPETAALLSAWRARADAALTAALQRLQRAVTARSAELGLPDGVLATRRGLLALMEQRQWPDILSGWRRAELEPVLAPLLERVPA